MNATPLRNALAVFFLSLSPMAAAQPDPASGLAQSTDFSIPSAPAFTLLDVTPALVRTPAFARDFRLDWIIKDNALVSDAAVSLAPLWMIAFSGLSAAEYQQLGWIDRQLSTLNVSVATAETDGRRRLALGTSINLYREPDADPLLNRAYIARLEDAIAFQPAELGVVVELERLPVARLAALGYDVGEGEGRTLYDALTAVVDANLNEETPPERVASYVALTQEQQEVLRPILSEIQGRLAALVPFTEASVRRLRTAQETFEHEHWNATRLDFGGGAAFTYDSPRLDSLDLDASGYGVWLNGATGLGTKRVLVSALGRGVVQEDDWSWFAGLNFRFGRNEDFNLFVEYVHEWLPADDLNTISYGGALRLSEQFLVQFGLRTSYDGAFEPVRLFPVIKLNGQAIPSISSLF